MDDLFGNTGDSEKDTASPIDTLRSLNERGDGTGATKRQLPRTQAGHEPPSVNSIPGAAMSPGSEAFTDWFGESVATDEQGKPLLLFRGEHGEPDAPDTLQHRTSSICFSTLTAANLYAEDPNDLDDAGSHKRVIPAYLLIENPVMNNRHDPFLEFEDIIAAIGTAKAEQIARDMATWIEETDHWGSNYDAEYHTVANLLDHAPERLVDLFVQAWPVFDKPRYVSWFAEAGYDGAVHGGCAATLDEPEYKAFAPSQVRSALAHQTFAPSRSHAGASPAIEGALDAFANHEAFARMPPASSASLSRVDGRTGEVANATAIGDLLRQVAYESKEVLMEEGLSCDWMDGGSLMFARALQKWSGGQVELGVASRDGKIATHAVGILTLGDSPDSSRVFLDADGVSTSGDLLAKLNHLEETSYQPLIATGDNAEIVAQALPENEGVTRRTVTGLRMSFPSFDGWKTKLHRDLEKLGVEHSVNKPIEQAPASRPPQAPLMVSDDMQEHAMKDLSQEERQQATHRGINLLHDLLATSNVSEMLADTQPAAVEAVLALHQRMLTTSQVPLPDYADGESVKAVDYRPVVSHYAENKDRMAAFLRLVHQAVGYSAPLAKSHPSKGPQEQATEQTRRDMMAFLVDYNPHWIEAYQQSPEGRTRRERHTLALALGGHSVGATPVERLLASAGEIIDTMAAMPDRSTKMKAALLSSAHDSFASQYGFDPSWVIVGYHVEPSEEGDITTAKMSFWNAVARQAERMTITTKPGETPMSRSQLIEAAAQHRWVKGDVPARVASDMATFSRQVLDYSLPERVMPEEVGQHLGHLSDSLEASLARYAPAEHEQWLTTEVLATYCLPVHFGDEAATFAGLGLTCGIGANDHLAATHPDSAMPKRASYDPDNGFMVVVEHGSTLGLEAALNELYPAECIHRDKYVGAAYQAPEAPPAEPGISRPVSGMSPG